MPQHGYLYFKLPEGNEQAVVKAEWSDLKGVAGTGQAVAFGNWGLVGNVKALTSRTADSRGVPYLVELTPGGGKQTDVRVRPASETPTNPGVYSTNAGVVKLSDQGNRAELVRQLKEALKAR
jgi:hypothetical protein